MRAHQACSRPSEALSWMQTHEKPFTESWEIINTCCFQPLSFGVVCYAGIETETVGTTNVCKFLGQFIWTCFSLPTICDQPGKLKRWLRGWVCSFICQIFSVCLLRPRQFSGCQGCYGECSSCLNDAYSLGPGFTFLDAPWKDWYHKCFAWIYPLFST